MAYQSMMNFYREEVNPKMKPINDDLARMQRLYMKGQMLMARG